MKTAWMALGCAVGLLAGMLVAPSRVAAQEGDDLVGLVVNLLTEKDKDLRALGFEQVRTTAKGKGATEKFAALLAKLSPEAQVGLLSALADRGDAAARPAVVELLGATKSDEVKVAAISALGPLGEPSDIPQLTKFLSSTAKAEQAAAKASLVKMTGEQVSAGIVAELKKAQGALRITLIDILVTRRGKEGIPTLLAIALESDPAARAAAMTALGQLADSEQIGGMVQGVLKAAPGAERVAAERAVALVASRVEDPAKRADALLAAMKKLSSADYQALLPTLGRVGGPAALKEIEAALASSDSELRYAGLLALCNWPDASTADRLTQIATKDEEAAYRNLALKALIRVAPLPDGRTDADRLALSQKVLAMCKKDDEKKLVVERVRAIRSVEALRFVVPYLDQPAFAQKACETVVELAHHRALREPNKAEFHKALDRVIAISKDPVVVDRANRYKNGETWVRPKAEEK